jgi:hypothetical protein
MTPEERQMLTDLANKIAQTPSPAHDPEAEEFIRTHIGNRPDALYLMTQTVLIQNMAIGHAQQEIQQLKQQQAQQPAPAQGGSGFLGGQSWSQPQPQAPQQAPQYGAPPPQYAQQPPAYGQPQPAYAPPQSQGGGMGSFLRSAGTTAAGIAAGALAFEGIRSMFGGAGHMFGMGNQPQFGGGSGFLGGGGGPVEETVVNNYYDRPQGEGSDAADNLGPDDSAQYDDTDVSPDDNVADDNVADDSGDYADSDDGSSGGDDLV